MKNLNPSSVTLPNVHPAQTGSPLLSGKVFFMEEIWKEIDGYMGYYEVSNKGSVRSMTRNVNNRYNTSCKKNGRIMNLFTTKYGYLRVRLCKYGIIKNYHVHKLVAQAFVDNIDKKPQINHIDCNKTNNNYANLEWCTQNENMRHAAINRLFPTGCERNGTKVFKMDAINVENLKRDGYNVKQITELTGVCRTNVYLILNNKHWSQLKIEI